MRNSKDIYYQKRKNDPAFRKHRAELQAAYVAAHPKVKEYYRNYQKQYYKDNKEKLDEQRKHYPDPTRNERVNKFKKREREALGKNYILALITRSGKIKKEEVTPYMIKKRRAQILQKRAAKDKER